MAQLHVVMTVNSAWNIWNFRRAVVQALIDDGHAVTVCAPLDESVAALRSLGCGFIPLEMSPKGLNPLEGVRLQNQLKALFKTEKPDVVLSYTIKNNIFGALAARAVEVPFIPNVTGLGTAFLSGGLMQTVAEALYRPAFRDLPVVFFQNEDDRALFIERDLIQGYQAQLLPGSGINLRYFAPAAPLASSDAPVFLMIARLLRDKGVFEFVEAARQVRAQRPDVRFQLLGAGGSDNRTAVDAKTVQAWVDEGVVEYLGVTDDVRRFIAGASCVVLPSYREGAPRTLIEAAAMARPVITTDAPGCRSVVRDGETGFLCAVKDPQSLAAACLKVVSLSAEARREMGQRGRRLMEREYDQSIVVGKYRAAIAHVLGARVTP